MLKKWDAPFCPQRAWDGLKKLSVLKKLRVSIGDMSPQGAKGTPNRVRSSGLICICPECEEISQVGWIHVCCRGGGWGGCPDSELAVLSGSS